MVNLKKTCRTSRSDLLSLLSQACEFEHGLACAYLYTSFSLKQEISEGMDWRQQQLARRWANDIFVVAAEEMLHLAQVWNLIAAIGGNPYYWRPNFPVASNYYPTGLPITLDRFSLEAIDKFIVFETPDDQQRQRVCQEHGIKVPSGTPPYGSVAELYTVIEETIKAIPNDQLFIGDPARQVDHELVDFPELIKIVDQESAIAAVHLIKEQGEGALPSEVNEDDPLEQWDIDPDGHHGVFIRMREEYAKELADAEKNGTEFDIVRNVLTNPVAKKRLDYGVPVVTEPTDTDQDVGRLIQDPYAAEVAVLFDKTYLLMLRLLQYIFRNSTDDSETLRCFAKTAIGIMITLIKPLGESLMLLSAGEVWQGKTAGPAFGLSRHVTLPEEQHVANVIVQERLTELEQVAERLSADARAPVQLKKSVANLKRWRALLEQVDASTPV